MEQAPTSTLNDISQKMHPLAPKTPSKSLKLGADHVEALIAPRLCEEPIWLSVHRSQKLQRQAFGEVFDYD